MDDLPQQQLARMISGYRISQAVYVAAKLGLADLLDAGPRTADDLAVSTHTHPRALYRLLRALASVGVFAEDDQRQFSLTPLASCLRTDAPGSLRAMAMTAGNLFYSAWGELLYSVQTGQAAFEKFHGKPIFDYLSSHADLAARFDETMVAVHGRETAAMLQAYDFTGIRTLADIGGGNGSVLSAVLQRYPQMHGILFDLPGVVSRARSRIEAAGLATRCQMVGGSFFESIPGGADTYLLRHIIHDWNDDQCKKILGNVHRAMPAGARLLIVESVIAPGNDPSPAKLLDLAMLVLPGGLERTEAEFRQLYQSAGFQLSRIVPTAADVSVIEGVKI